MNRSYISITGTMGVGKSTLTERLSKELGYAAFFEEFAENIFLPRFYKNKKRWAFHSQTYFLINKMEQLVEIKKLKKNIVQDSFLAADIASYVQAQYELGYMEKAEWALYRRLYGLKKDDLPEPNLIVFLTASTPAIFDRIKKRKRTYETNHGKQSLLRYLEVLQRLNRGWIDKMKNRCRVVEVDTTAQNYFADKTEWAKLVAKIKAYEKI
ncbi:deoxynucleoside kinase [Candidatus Roizmanbacteria bacterium]|nr:deoxynucleoside kinase [Candidatus Roizmanbacteria bacterium]